MTPGKLDDLLSRLHTGVPDHPGHRAALKAELLGRFRRLHPPFVRRTLRARPLGGLVFAGALLLLLFAAARAPAEYAVDLGERVTIALPEGVTLPRGPELLAALRGVGLDEAGELPPDRAESPPAGAGRLQLRTREAQVQVEVQRLPSGQRVLQIDLWGGAVASGLDTRLRQAFPALREAQISVTPLQGRARGTVGRLLGERLFNLAADPASVEQARRELQEELRRQGDDGQVELKIEDQANGRRKVMLKVQSEKTMPEQAEKRIPEQSEKTVPAN